MKIKVIDKSYKEVMEMPREERKRPVRPSAFFRSILKIASAGDLKATNFKYEMHAMEKLGKDEPCLILMNHSSFIDLKIAVTIFNDRPLNIVCTSDGFVGKSGLMRKIGCIPAVKFVTDVAMVKDIKYALDKLQNSVLMYPEASYTFDGTATPLPESVGKSIKFFKVPVVMIKTYGAFARDPLYNNLQLRDVDVSADVTYLLSKEDIANMSVAEINKVLEEQFTFDNFKWQKEAKVKIDEPFRADYLNRVLYKCPKCNKEGEMEGKGTQIKCKCCDHGYELSELGELIPLDGEAIFKHIPDWYEWERAEVRKELEENKYELSVPVDIHMLVDTKSVYNVGSSHLVHNSKGFELTGCDGQLHYVQLPQHSYSLYSDYYWYEIGDMICIGDTKALYYCFPKESGDFVAKARLAAEELYKMHT